MPRPPGTDLEKLAFFGLLSGSTSLIPIPFVDDWAYRFVRREMVEAVFSAGPFRLSEAQLAELTRAAPGRRRFGCLGRAGYLFFWLPLRFAVYFVLRLFKKILVFLVIKEAADRASLIFHEGYLFERASRDSRFSFDRPDWPNRLRLAVEETVRSTDTSPVRGAVKRVFRESGEMFSGVTRSTLALFRKVRRAGQANPPEPGQAREFLEQEEELLSGPTGLFLRLVTGESNYFSELEKHFWERVEREGP